MPDKNVMFRTSMGGFNKSDVTAYIDKLNADFRELTEKQNKALADKDAEIVQLKEKAEKAEEQSDALSEKDAKINELLLQISELEQKIAKLQEEKDAEIKELKEKLSGEASENERKAELYDDMSAQFGSILISANKSADSIISEANAKAAEINLKAASDAAELRRAFTSKMTEISDGAKKSAKATAEDYRLQMRAELDQLRGVLTDAVVSVDEKSTILSKMTDEFEKKLNEQLDGTVAEIEKETENLKNGI